MGKNLLSSAPYYQLIHICRPPFLNFSFHFWFLFLIAPMLDCLLTSLSTFLFVDSHCSVSRGKLSSHAAGQNFRREEVRPLQKRVIFCSPTHVRSLSSPLVCFLCLPLQLRLFFSSYIDTDWWIIAVTTNQIRVTFFSSKETGRTVAQTKVKHCMLHLFGKD